MIKYLDFLLEHKFWGKTIPQFLSWLESKSNSHFIICDTETSGLPSDPYEVQLTQVACIVTKYNYASNYFEEIDTFNKKIKLTESTLKLMENPNYRIKAVLNFNHYGEGGHDYYEEENVLQEFFEFINQYNNPILVIQNAIFDMRYLNTRNPIVKFNNEVLDTKQVIQLFYLPLLQKLAETDDQSMDMINKIGKSNRDNGLISSSMSKIGPALNLDMNNYHDAISDCRITIKMLNNIVLFLKENQDLDIKKYQVERIKNL